MTIRRIIPDEEAARRLAALGQTCFPDRTAHWSAADVGLHAQAPGGHLLADTDIERGYLALRVAADEAEVLDVGVVPEAQRQGLATALLKAAADLARREGAERLFLEVAADNAPALALYQRAGFEQVGTRPGYYRRLDGTRADALILALSLRSTPES